LRPIRTVGAALPATFESLGNVLSRHRAITRVSLTALSFTLVFAMSQQATPVTQAGPEAAPRGPESLLPQTLGVGLATDASITIPFDAPMDAASVEAALQVVPAQALTPTWNDDGTELSLVPTNRWRTDERYLVTIGADARANDGSTLGSTRRFAFSTQTAPTVRDVQVRLAGVDAEPEPAAFELAGETALLRGTTTSTPAATEPELATEEGVSASTRIAFTFSAPMDRQDTEARFAINPEVDGSLTWEGDELVFVPGERLEPGARYTVSVVGAHDADGNVLDGTANFSFIVQRGAQITKTVPEHRAMNVEPAQVEIWFSQPMDVTATNEAFAMTDTNTGRPFAGTLSWNDAGTQLVYTPDEPFVAGHTFGVTLGAGARDADGNPVDADWYFTITPPPAAPAPVVTTRSAPTTPSVAPPPPPPPAAPATSLAGYALNQVNAARAAYGRAPLVLDAAISAVASAHAWDQANNGYFSHTGLDGSTRDTRLRRGGVSYTYSGENQCYYVGMSQQATLDWCHQQFMAEPYPGYWNHKANILDARFTRMGVGIATVNGRTVITWNFTD
jgi:uncharacterized protein YkwD